ncbi:MAG: hypothetical protein HIU92_05000 [Proteobacteria bacterium]|nr:hypothetical protein [Pseudomonadota bacterium]
MKKRKPFPARPLWHRLRDALLLPLALLLVPLEWVIREGSRVLRRWAPVRHLESRLARLPPWAILPLFLIPEGMSHIAGFYAAYLLAHGNLLAATAVVLLFKGTGLLLALWIYQACRPALMTIGWFAWGHGKLEAARDWGLERIRPAWGKARRLLRRLVWGRASEPEPGAAHGFRRLAAMRARLRTRMRMRFWPMGPRSP